METVTGIRRKMKERLIAINVAKLLCNVNGSSRKMKERLIAIRCWARERASADG
jgi:hypothetical protein